MKAPPKTGDWMIYRKTKFSTTPGPRASAVAPSRHGEGYSYIVDKFWVVAETLGDNRLRLRTRRGKEHVIRADDPNLRPARWWENLFFGSRFPKSVLGANRNVAERQASDTQASARA